MSEQPPIVARIKFRDPYPRTVIGKGLTTAYIVNALRDYFNDNTKQHYWEVDTSVVGGDYDIFTNAAPYDTATNKHTSLVLKPKAGAPGGTSQRIVFITKGSNLNSGVGWGSIQVGYLPDGTFDPTDGVKHNNAASIQNAVLLTAPAEWSTFRNLSSIAGDLAHIGNEFTIVEYRDDPAIHSDPGQSLFLALHIDSTLDDYTNSGARERVWMDRKMFKWDGTCLVGRVIQPFTKYHEEAIGNKGDALFTGYWSGQTSFTQRPMAESGWNQASYIDDSSIVRVAPNCWSIAYAYLGGLIGVFLLNDLYSFNLGDWKQPMPITYAGNPALVVRNGLHVNTTANFSIYGYSKQFKQMPYSSAGWDGTWLSSDDTNSDRAWAKFPGFKNVGNDCGRVLLWNKNGPQLLSYLQ